MTTNKRKALDKLLRLWNLPCFSGLTLQQLVLTLSGKDKDGNVVVEADDDKFFAQARKVVKKGQKYEEESGMKIVVEYFGNLESWGYCLDSTGGGAKNEKD